MDDEAAFLRAILAAPDDDLPRLVYADWLEERGEGARAELIRVQIEIANYGHIEPTGETRQEVDANWLRWSQRRIALHRRERALLAQHIGTWTDNLPEKLVTRQCPSCVDSPADYETNAVECRRCDGTGIIPDYDNIEWHRGFVEVVTCAWKWFRAHTNAIKASTIRRVRLTTWPTGCPSAAPETVLAWLRSQFDGLTFELPPAPRGIRTPPAEYATDWEPMPRPAAAPRP